jgi:dihydropteroate synthase
MGVNLKWAGYSLDLEQRTCVMGVLNVTPDSFSDGGCYFDFDRAV